MHKNITFSQRMKNFEATSTTYLERKQPVIIRVDGKNFSNLTKKNCQKPFDSHFIECMKQALLTLCKEIQCVKLAYAQSDEISLLLTDYEDDKTEPWFGNKVQKMVSISASLATSSFGGEFRKRFPQSNTQTLFDSRVFNLPKDEVVNYFIWRQRDAERNSITMLAQEHFSSKELIRKDSRQRIAMLLERGVGWHKIDPVFQRGMCAMRQQAVVDNTIRKHWIIDTKIPSFGQQRDYIGCHA